MTFRRGGGSVPGTVPDTVLVIPLFSSAPDVAGEHGVQYPVGLIDVAVGETVVGRDVERECVNLLRMCVEERLEDVDFAWLCLSYDRARSDLSQIQPWSGSSLHGQARQ